ncbi:hypothetical protein BTN50_1144 [Candidatus Enterovibrio altilux]|uniref:Uncharacterized protein n=1 Tax=Candidatus Enterovibrio altilux TaxID=1927128 RepID=A0A291B9F2_9GAMM|nr:hypothetical protein BTN50_1144 [Candidatus Enterovibrio luxaltus]
MQAARFDNITYDSNIDFHHDLFCTIELHLRIDNNKHLTAMVIIIITLQKMSILNLPY